MFVAIEIGGTKLQVAAGRGDGSPLVESARRPVPAGCNAAGIRAILEPLVGAIVARLRPTAIGIGFGGPVDAATGRTVTSHQVDGWDDFPLAEWCRQRFHLPAVVANDSDSAGLAEARFGAGKGSAVVFYSNVGSGIGGALVIGGRLYRGAAGIASEPGHLRPGPWATADDQTVESLASGWAIAAAARALAADPAARLTELDLDAWRRQTGSTQDAALAAAELKECCGGDLGRLSTEDVARAALAGNAIAAAVFDRACRVFGWALAQVVTLNAPAAIVVGGGVSLVPDELFLGPLRRWVEVYAFPPLRGTYHIVPAALGEEVVLHGALALAAGAAAEGLCRSTVD